METELVSVIIACYNGEAHIDMCLHSLINLNYKNLEIIICDDASTDNSWALLQRWQQRDQRIILLKNRKNLFQASARNSCIHIAKGKYLLMQDIDDLSEPNRVEVLLANLKEHKVDFVSSSMATIDDEGVIDRARCIKHKKTFPTKYDLLWNPPFNHPASLFTTEVVRRVNGYRVAKETRRGEDYDLYMRLYANGARGMNVGDSVYIYRLDADNFKRRTFATRLEDCIIRYKGYKKLGLLFLGFPLLVKPILVYFVRKLLLLR